jgi:uncharacterized protein (DUF362 family)
VVTAGSALLPVEGGAAPSKPTIYVVHGDDPKKMLHFGIEKFGGFGALVKKGKKVTLKPNVAWASRPEQGGNTDPNLVGATVSACLAAGASKVVIPEHTCSDAKKAFKMSGVEAAVKKAGGEIYSLGENKKFRKVKIPKGKSITEAEVAVDVLDTGLLINMPVAKSHSSCTITGALKNWMGSVLKRKSWHSRNLHQCVADFSTFLKADLIIADATRVMTTEGPRGPGKMAYPKQLVFGKDPVAVDAYLATLFKLKPFDIAHIKLAHEMKVGIGDLRQVNAVHLDCA